MSKGYDVALWRYYFEHNGPFPEVMDNVPAASPLLAVLSVMKHYRFRHVVRAAVKAPDNTFTRWEDGLSLLLDTNSEEQEEEVLYE